MNLQSRKILGKVLKNFEVQGFEIPGISSFGIFRLASLVWTFCSIYYCHCETVYNALLVAKFTLLEARSSAVKSMGLSLWF